YRFRHVVSTRDSVRDPGTRTPTTGNGHTPQRDRDGGRPSQVDARIALVRSSPERLSADTPRAEELVSPKPEFAGAESGREVLMPRKCATFKRANRVDPATAVGGARARSGYSGRWTRWGCIDYRDSMGC